MWNSKKSVTLSIIVCFAVALIIAVVAVSAPWIIEYYFYKMRGIAYNSTNSIIIKSTLSCLYPSVALGFIALYSLIKMLLNIRTGNIFIMHNVKLLRIISWCCFGVAAITLVGGIFYAPFLFIAIAAGFVGLILRVVKNVMQSAVELREENDLTI